MNSELLTERRGATLVLTLSDPATRNTLSPQACAAGIEALNIAEGNPELRCVVLRGDGAHFCSGGNLQRLSRTRQVDAEPIAEPPQDGRTPSGGRLAEPSGPEQQAQNMEHFHGFIDALRAFPKPVIAAVEGAAAGGGFSLALACDLIVAAEDARFIMSYGRVGLSPDGGGSWQLANALPRALALQMVWLAEPLGARQLQALGLVNWVTDSGQALAEALRIADRLAEMAPNALASAKELINQAPSRSLREQLDSERDHFVQNLFHPNGGEGLQAFIDKRAPKFR
ncbi:MAG TPA: enoyl-CoA hydratase [Burkholderiaceae bacterium]|jgi:enoyl-CoA hydratase/carnithine racemase|nr:enoyl-CoA hydratase [Burkholderiaceae bacterium]